MKVIKNAPGHREPVKAVKADSGAKECGLFYDHFTVGRKFLSRRHAMERDRLVEFAQEFDPQPQHLSEADAVGSRFGALVASGWHTASVSMRLFVDALPSVCGGLQGAALEDLAWPRPVRPGDELRVEAEVLWKRESNSRPKSGLVKIRVTTLNQNDEIVQTATHIVIMQKSQTEPIQEIGPGQNATTTKGRAWA